MDKSLEIQFSCSNCGELLQYEKDGNYIESEETHTCFGERIGLMAIIDSSTVKTQDGISLSYNDS